MKSRKKNYRHPFLYLLSILLIFSALTVGLKKSAGLISAWLTPARQPVQKISIPAAVRTALFFSNETPINNKQLASQSDDFIKLIVQEINNSKDSLEIAMYSIKSPRIKTALYAAAARGVKVTLILDFRKSVIHDEFFADLPISITRLDLGTDGPGNVSLMHHKFALIDRGQSTQRLIFGSFNWTELQAVYDNSFMMMTDNAELITSFGREFQRLQSGVGEKDKLADSAYRAWDLELSAPSGHYEVWFGPGRDEYGLQQRLGELIDEAQQDIKIMAWSFTDRSVAGKILQQARAGRHISIIADSFNFSSTSSVLGFLEETKKAERLDNLEILRDRQSLPPSTSGELSGADNIDPFLHYHLLIIDNKKILFGTNNWSRGGFYNNDESAIVSDDQGIVRKFLESFNYNYWNNCERKEQNK